MRQRIVSYGGNDDAASRLFADRTGIAVQKWDVGDIRNAFTPLPAIEADHASRSTLVNNAGTTMMMMKMTGTSDEVIRVDPTGCFSTWPRRAFAGMRTRGWGSHRQHRSVNGQAADGLRVNHAVTTGHPRSPVAGSRRWQAPWCVTANVIARAISLLNVVDHPAERWTISATHRPPWCLKRSRAVGCL
jgi:acetoacetyl-CoA reductase